MSIIKIEILDIYMIVVVVIKNYYSFEFYKYIKNCYSMNNY